MLVSQVILVDVTEMFDLRVSSICSPLVGVPDLEFLAVLALDHNVLICNFPCVKVALHVHPVQLIDDISLKLLLRSKNMLFVSL